MEQEKPSCPRGRVCSFRLLQPCYLQTFPKLCRSERTFPFVPAFLLTNCTTAFLTKNTVTLNALHLFINSHIMLI